MMRAALALFTVQWERKLSAFLWAVIVYQFIRWLSQQSFDGVYWLDQSRWSAQISLLLAMLVESLVHVRRWLRYMLTIFCMVTAHLLFLEVDWHWIAPANGEIFMVMIRENFQLVMPYAVFGVVTVFLYWALIYWAASKGIIICFIILSVIIFSIVDSFSKTLYLWTEVVYTIFSGLLLVMIRHLSDFKLRHPVSWQWLKEYPGKLAVPISFLISVLFLASIFTPHSRPFLTDPYTWWLSTQGEEVSGIGKVFGDPSFVEILSEAQAESGYSRDDTSIGGGFNYDYTEVMTVSTSHRSYWRGEVRSVYTGKGWESGELDRFATSYAVASGDELRREDGINISLLETVDVIQTITMMDDTSFPVLFAAYAPSSIAFIEGEEFDLSNASWHDHQQELRWDEEAANGNYPTTYQIVSKMPIVDEEGLRKASTQLPSAMADAYLQLPDTVTDRVRQLAVDITAEASNAYDKMKQLEFYLKTEYRYTNSPDQSNATEDDFVDDFLFHIKEGYCDYYSTAMVVMARSLGIPARWVKGYTAGTSEFEMYMTDYEQEMGLNPNGSGTYIVKMPMPTHG